MKQYKEVTKKEQLGLCDDCKKFIKTHKKWNEHKVPEVAIMSAARCKKCKVDYQIYKDMIFVSKRCSK